jgi:hypothetical protein
MLSFSIVGSDSATCLLDGVAGVVGVVTWVLSASWVGPAGVVGSVGIIGSSCSTG